jgi:hypothetical protein
MSAIRTTLFILFLLLTMNIEAQKRVTVSGHVRDAKTGEELIGASIAIKETGAGTIANQYGF